MEMKWAVCLVEKMASVKADSMVGLWAVLKVPQTVVGLVALTALHLVDLLGV